LSNAHIGKAALAECDYAINERVIEFRKAFGYSQQKFSRLKCLDWLVEYYENRDREASRDGKMPGEGQKPEAP
jgi:hypothetical protein